MTLNYSEIVDPNGKRQPQPLGDLHTQPVSKAGLGVSLAGTSEAACVVCGSETDAPL